MLRLHYAGLMTKYRKKNIHKSILMLSSSRDV